MSVNNGIVNTVRERNNSNIEKEKIHPIHKPRPQSLYPEPGTRNPRVPILVQTIITSSWAVVMITGLGTALISYLSGSNEMDIILRSGSAILIVGIFLWIITSLIVRGSVEAAQKLYDERVKLKEEEAKKQKGEQSLSINA